MINREKKGLGGGDLKSIEKKSKQLLAGKKVKAVNSGEQKGKSQEAAGWEAGKVLKSSHKKSKH